MAVRRKKKTAKKVSKAYEQSMGAEGMPVALDLLGFGSTISDLIRGKSPKPAEKKRAKKKSRTKLKAKTKSKTVRTKKKAARKSRRRR